MVMDETLQEDGEVEKGRQKITKQFTCGSDV